MSSYTKKETLEKLDKISDLSEIYSNEIINYRGSTKDTNEKYTEVIAEEIFNNPQKYDYEKIKQITRKKSYKVETHDGIFDPNSPRKEEIIAMQMFKQKYEDIGEIIDYQVPLKDSRQNKGIGKIDLISYNNKTNTLYLIELKNYESKETLLRCALEVETYSKQVDGEKLKTDFGLPKTANIKPAILIFEETRPYDDLNDRYVNKLIEKFNIDVFIAKRVYNINKFNTGM